MYKKLLAAMLVALIAVTMLLAGCSNESLAPNTTPNEQPSTADPTPQPTKPSESEDPTPATANGGGTSYDDLADFSTMPEDLSDVAKPRYYQITGQLDATPGTTVKTTENTDYYLTISIPVIPDHLKSFADSRGDYYCLLYIESKIDGTTGAFLAFYEETLTFKFGPGNTPNNCDVIMKYGFSSSNGALLMADTNTNIGYANNELSPYMETENITLDPYTSTSFTPSDTHIDIVTQAV